jgi:hypothetical protein
MSCRYWHVSDKTLSHAFNLKWYLFCLDWVVLVIWYRWNEFLFLFDLVNFWQEEIHELLLNFAEAGATVVRLKGGDPLVSFHLGSSSLRYYWRKNLMHIIFLWFVWWTYVNVLLFGICRCLGGVVKKWIFCNSKVSMLKLFQVCWCSWLSYWSQVVEMIFSQSIYNRHIMNFI